MTEREAVADALSYLCHEPRGQLLAMADAAIAAMREREVNSGAASVREVSEEEAKRRLLDGDRIVFSMDGDEAWFDGGDRAHCTDVVISLRQKGYLTRKAYPDCDRGFCWDEASDYLRALATDGEG